MNRKEYRDAHHAVRADARKNAPHQPLNHNGLQNALRVQALIALPKHGVIRISAARGGSYPSSDTAAEVAYEDALLPPMRVRVTEALQRAARYRADAQQTGSDWIRRLAKNLARGWCEEARQIRESCQQMPR